LARAARAARAGRVFLLFSPLERRAFGEAALHQFDGWLVKPVRAASLIERLAPAIRGAAPAASAAPEPVLAGLQVLLAEDNDINALIVTRHLGALGALVTWPKMAPGGGNRRARSWAPRRLLASF